MWDTRFFIAALGDFLSIFTDIWGQMCKPFIMIIRSPEAGFNPIQEYRISYLLIPMTFGFAVCAIALTKKIMFMFIGRGSVHDV